MMDVQLRVMATLANAQTETDAGVALASTRETIALARKVGQRGSMIQAVGNLGYTGLLAGEWDEPLAEMDAVLAEASLGDSQQRAHHQGQPRRVDR